MSGGIPAPDFAKEEESAGAGSHNDGKDCDSDPAEFTLSNDPLENELILELVLKHVGKANTTDLKNCRLVNRAWNRVAVPILEQQHAYSLELDYSGILTFQDLLQQAHLSRGRSVEGLASLQMSLSLNLCSTNTATTGLQGHPENPDSGQRTCPIAISQLTQLLLLYPHLRVAHLKCTQSSSGVGSRALLIKGQVNWELFSLLKMISNTLITIAMTYEDSIEEACPRFEQFDFQRYYGTLTFPKLTSLSYQTKSSAPLQMPRGVGNEDLTRHVVSIIQAARAPKLNNLTLDLWEGRREGGAKDLLRTILKGCSSRLESLEIVEGDVGLLYKTLAEPELQLPKLKLFKNVNGFFTANTWAHQFLEQNCPSLRSLQLSWSPECEARAARVRAANLEPMHFGRLPFEFPLLPNVVHFEFKSHFSNKYMYLMRVHATFVTILAKLPSLKCLTIELEMLFMLGTYFSLSTSGAPQYPIFPQVSTLEVQVHKRKMVGLRIHRFPQMYYQIFPNLATLILKIDQDISPSCTAFDRAMLTRVLESLARHPGVENLEIHNYAYDWLTWPITTGIPDLDTPAINSPLLQDHLTSLKLFPGKAAAGNIHLLNLKRRFPSLLTIQLGNKIMNAGFLVP